MKPRELYNILFTEYPKIGYSPAIITMAIIVALGASIVIGGVSVGRSFFAHIPVAETGHS